MGRYSISAKPFGVYTVHTQYPPDLRLLSPHCHAVYIALRFTLYEPPTSNQACKRRSLCSFAYSIIVIQTIIYFHFLSTHDIERIMTLQDCTTLPPSLPYTGVVETSTPSPQPPGCQPAHCCCYIHCICTIYINPQELPLIILIVFFHIGA